MSKIPNRNSEGYAAPTSHTALEALELMTGEGGVKKRNMEDLK